MKVKISHFQKEKCFERLKDLVKNPKHSPPSTHLFTKLKDIVIDFIKDFEMFIQR